MDPRKVVSNIADHLLDYRIKSLHAFRDRLIAENEAKGNPGYGFLYGGEFHSQYPLNQIARLPKVILHKDLHEQGREYLQELKEFREDDTKLRQGMIMPITTACQDLQDVRDLLPEIIAPLVPFMAELPRTRPVGFAFTDKPIQAHSFQLISDLLEYHAAVRIL